MFANPVFITPGRIILRQQNKGYRLANFFIGIFGFTSESLFLFKGIVSKFHFHVNSSH